MIRTGCADRGGRGQSKHGIGLGNSGPDTRSGVAACLAEQPGTVVTRQALLNDVWDPHWYGPTRTIDVHVASVRKKLGDPRWIETVRGVGFRLGQLP